jgi:multicomponent Na+:H+ antiporter subunit B
MTSIILSTATRYLLPLLLLFSVFVTVRGHNEPGGGFVGGLVAAAAFSLYALANGVHAARRALGIDPRTLIGVGLLIAAGSGLIGLAAGLPFLTALWSTIPVPLIGKAGVPVFFDIGVYVAVVGVTLTIISALAEE